MTQSPKSLRWVGTSKKDLLAMPDEVIDAVGYALHLAQLGETSTFFLGDLNQCLF